MSDSESDDEASPNVELLFQQAFAEEDPAHSLKKVVNEHPTYEYIEFPLIRCYVEAVEKNPSRGQVFASALTKLDTFLADIGGQLDRTVLFNIDFDEEHKDYGPKNGFLFHSLLSGLSLKYGLVGNSIMYATIEKGLDPSPGRNDTLNSINPEVLVVGACIQLLLGGSVIPTERVRPGYRRSAELVAVTTSDNQNRLSTVVCSVLI